MCAFAWVFLSDVTLAPLVSALLATLAFWDAFMLLIKDFFGVDMVSVSFSFFLDLDLLGSAPLDMH